MTPDYTTARDIALSVGAILVMMSTRNPRRQAM